MGGSANALRSASSLRPVCLIEDDQIKWCNARFVKVAEATRRGQCVNGGDDEVCAFVGKGIIRCGIVDGVQGQTKGQTHLLAPMIHQADWRKDQNSVNAAPQEHFKDVKAGQHCLASA